MLPILLSANQPADRFYRGGPRVAAFRGVAAPGDHVPEDWIASVTTVAGETSLGLTTLPSGMLLREAVAADPVAWLGRDHLEAYGPDPLLLVKLIDPGQRLPVHAHPDSSWALRHLGRPHGKAEAWFILEAGEVFIGLRDPIGEQALLELVSTQDAEALIGLLHKREVAAGDAVFVPAGTPHAIGEKTFLAEVQQPEDLSILLEWRDFDLDGAADGHLGLGFPTALTAVDRRGRSDSDIAGLITSPRSRASVFDPASGQYFRAEHHLVDGELALESGFAVLITIAGELELIAAGGTCAAPRGATVLIPDAAERLLLAGRGTALIFRPPSPVWAAAHR